MCLIKGLEDQICKHNWCMLAAKKPQYWAIFKSDYIMNREDLGTFKLTPERHYGDRVLPGYVIAVNPNFEQSYAPTHGYWPEGREIFHKSEIAYTLIEEKVTVPIDGRWNSGSEMIDTVDLAEVVIYIGEGAKSCV